MNAPLLSVVLATTSADASVEEALRAIEAGCVGVATEIIVVSPAGIEPRGGVRAKLVTCAASALTPVRWGLGAAAATGRTIAFTTDQLRVGARWGAQLANLPAGVAGVGGPIALAPRSDAATAAAYLIRFSAFLPGAHGTDGAVDDVAGDNAAYDGAGVRKHGDLLANGFWEVEFHRRFASEGLALRMAAGATATFVGPMPTLALLAQRFDHAREFGRTRVAARGESRLRIVLFSPLVPFVLLARIRRRAARDAVARSRFVGALPRLVLLTIAWAVGEAIGALGAAR